MIKVSTAELKAKLGQYLKMVRGGERIEVTSHRHSVATIVPCTPERSVQVIEPRRPVEDLRRLGPVKLSKHADGLSLLFEDRGRR